MGRTDFEQDEDCLTLNIWSPPAGDGPYPVLVWIHGGGFITGSGSLPFYRGAQLARDGRLVVVAINYRLGALGYLYVPDLVRDQPGAANRGLLDQIAAIRWVRDNIAAFGGDPDAITVAGQSAGGAAIAAMMGNSLARSLFNRAILQSPVLDLLTSTDEAAAICDHLLTVLGISRARIAELKAVPVDHLLEAQIAATKQFARFGAPVGAIQQVVDGTVIRAGLIELALSAASTGMAVLLGTTRDEMHSFLMQDQTRSCDRPEALRLLGNARLQGVTESVFDAYLRASTRQSPARAASAILTDRHFRIPTLEFAHASSAGGASTYLYRFDWEPQPGSRYGACHCIDIPFALNNFEDWHSGPVPPAMLDGRNRNEVSRTTRQFQGSWVTFAQSGSPGHDGLPAWPGYTSSTPVSMQFGVESQLAANPDHYLTERWNLTDPI